MNSLYKGRWGKGWRKEHNGGLADGSTAHVFDEQNQLREVITYEATGDHCGEIPLYHSRVETADGTLLLRHIAHRVSDTEQDIHVLDAEDKLRLIIHHSEMDKGEPYTICEEWMET